MITGGTDNHIVVVDVFQRGITGVNAEKALEACGLGRQQEPHPLRQEPAHGHERHSPRHERPRHPADGARADMRECVELIDQVLAAVQQSGTSASTASTRPCARVSKARVRADLRAPSDPHLPRAPGDHARGLGLTPHARLSSDRLALLRATLASKGVTAPGAGVVRSAPSASARPLAGAGAPVLPRALSARHARSTTTRVLVSVERALDPSRLHARPRAASRSATRSCALRSTSPEPAPSSASTRPGRCRCAGPTCATRTRPTSSRARSPGRTRARRSTSSSRGSGA